MVTPACQHTIHGPDLPASSRYSAQIVLSRWKLLENRNGLVRGRQLSEGIANSNYVYSPITFTAVAPVCENEYLSEPMLINAVNQTCTINVEVMRNAGCIGISEKIRFQGLYLYLYEISQVFSY